MNSSKQGGSSLQEEVSGGEILNLTLENNKRLKDDYDHLALENSKLSDELKALEEEASNLKASLSASELKNESIMGTNVCLTSEIKRWKDRSDAFLRGSDHGQEWIKIQEELKEAQEKSQELTDMINHLRSGLAEAKVKTEQLEQELEASKAQLVAEKTKHQQDLDTLRLDKSKREEMFKTLVNELKEVVNTCQKELQLSIDWGSKGPTADKMRNVKEELSSIKKSIVDKIKSDRDELSAKMKLVEEANVKLRYISNYKCSSLFIKFWPQSLVSEIHNELFVEK